MKAPLCQLERVASGTHYALELLRLQLDTSKGCQGTIHNMPAEYDSTQLRSTRSLGQLSHRPCQENPTLPEGSLASILPAWWAASAEQGGWICKYIPTGLERNSNDAQRAEPV